MQPPANHAGQNPSAANCIHQLFQAQVERTPDAVALVFEDQCLTYRQLNQRADELARELRQLGVGPEVCVGVCLMRSLEMVVGLYAIHKAGGAYVPLDPTYPPERIALMLEDAQVPVLLTQRAVLDLLPASAAVILRLDNPDPESGTRSEAQAIRNTEPGTRNTHYVKHWPDPSPEDLAYVIYTSGSTGKPKGVMVRHRNVLNFFAGMDEVLGRAPGVWLAVTSISFDISVLELFWTLTRGFKVIVQEDEAAAVRTRSLRRQASDGADYSIAAQILRHRVTHLQCTPSLASMMTQEPKTLAALKQVRHFLFGGEPLPPALVEQFAGTAQIFNMYGPTETTVWSTFYRVTPETHYDGKTIPIGRPLLNTDIHILDPQLQPVALGETGELVIGGAGVARGYLRRPELTAERFIPSPFTDNAQDRCYRTGDLVRYRQDGNLEFLGRVDHQVKLRGFRIELGEIESVLRQCPAVQESVVSVWEPSPNNKRLVAYYVCKPGAVAEASELKALLKTKLPESMVPQTFCRLDAFPLTPNGKIARQALPAPGAQSLSAAPKTEITAPLALKAADSLRPGAEALPITEAQREIWYASQLSDALSCSFHLSVALTLRGALDVPRLGHSLESLVERHPALRATFSAQGDCQHVSPSQTFELQVVDLASITPETQPAQLQAEMERIVNQPFDLVRGPLWRTKLVRLGPTEHVLLLAIHHLICDGMSLSILLEELGAFYSRSADQPGAQSSARSAVDAAAAYRDFISEQAAALQSEERRTAEAFWLNQYSRPAPILDLPTDRTRPGTRTFAGGTVNMPLEEPLMQDLKLLSRQLRCSLGTTLLSGFYLLLHRLTGQADLVVGVPMTCRSGDQAECLVGHCVNFLPLRLRLEENSTFSDHVGRVARLLLEAHEHQNYTLGSLLQKLNLPRSQGRLPLASVMFNLELDDHSPRFAGLQAETKWNPYCHCRFDLSLNLTEIRSGLTARCQYSAEFFDSQTVGRCLRDFQSLLKAAVAASHHRLHDLVRSLPPMPRPAAQPSARPVEDEATLTGAVAGRARQATVLPLDPIETTLAEIWREVVVLEAVGREDNFFDVGGHSLLATQVISRVARAFNVELPLRAIFETPTIAGLAGLIRDAQRYQPSGPSLITRRAREAKARKVLERLDRLSEAELEKLLRNPQPTDS